LNTADMLLALSENDRAAAIAPALAFKGGLRWLPNEGPQQNAYFSKADELFYGGQAGGGKTDLGLGLALNEHKHTLILRRINKDAVKIVSRLEEILGDREGYNGQLQRWRLPGDKSIEFAGCEMEADRQRFKGTPHDLIIYDEGTDFLESQFRFINAWNRSADPNQRCRVLVTSNPPTTPEGLWVIQYWAPWLDPAHPNPAKPGELRWFTTINGKDTEVDGPGPHAIPGEAVPIRARSRTYLPAALKDNPDLAATNYDSVLAGLPEELRRAYRDGDFTTALSDDEWQVIPTAWIEAAQQRWRDHIPDGTAMTAMAVDVAQGGVDQTVLAYRYGGWFARLDVVPGSQTPDGASVAAMIVRRRRDQCPVIIDVGGGYGGDAVGRCKDNAIAAIAFNGANSVTTNTKDGKLKFRNKRAEAWWRMREELDPSQEGGSSIALPPDGELKADLASARWKLSMQGIQLEDKNEIKKRIGRSPDRGDAAVMCLSEGQTALRREMRRSGVGVQKFANVGYSKLKQHAMRR
jgi:hypothetical protein